MTNIISDTNEPEFVEEFAHCAHCDQQLTANEVSFLDHYGMCHPDLDTRLFFILYIGQTCLNSFLTRHLYSGEPEDKSSSEESEVESSPATTPDSAAR